MSHTTDEHVPTTVRSGAVTAAAARAEACGLPDIVEELADDRARQDQVRRTTRAIRTELLDLGREEAVDTQIVVAAAGTARAARRRAAGEAIDTIDELRRFERIVAGNELADVNYLARGVAAARSVGRVVIREHGRVAGYGTGFLVAPGVLMTNEHVLPGVDVVAGSSVQLDYERDADGTELAPQEFVFATDPSPIIYRDLDVALVAVSPATAAGVGLDRYGWLRLDATPGKGVIGEYLTIIQHPGGERKQICVRENKLLHYDPNAPYLQYQTDTVGGSSGSPVFNNSWDVVGLHHCGVPRTRIEDGRPVILTRTGAVWDDSMSDDAIDWYANEGVRISRIMAYLRAVHSDDPIGRAVLAAPLPPHQAMPATAGTGATGGMLHLDVPITIGTLAAPAAPSVAARTAPVAPRGDADDVYVIEERSIDRTNYDERNGYDPNFLGAGAALEVPLPTIASSRANEVLRLGGESELRYWNYTVVMNSTRDLAFFSAANADPFGSTVTRPGNPWIADDRIAAALGASHQVTGSFYGAQSQFEADRTENPFDQGHLSSSEDMLWPDSIADATTRGLDTFHYTNCVPQYWNFNEHHLWRRLERAAAEISGKHRFCVFNGPIFDAPVSAVDADGDVTLDLDGPAAPDPKFGGVAIPKLFYKVVVWEHDDGLRSAGFVASHEPGLGSVGRLDWDERIDLTESAKDVDAVIVYLTPISTITRLTGVQFDDAVVDSQHDPRDEAVFVGSGRIRDLDDLRAVF